MRFKGIEPLSSLRKSDILTFRRKTYKNYLNISNKINY